MTAATSVQPGALCEEPGGNRGNNAAQLIASCKRKGPESGSYPSSSAKRQRITPATDVRGSSTDFQRQQDQQNAPAFQEAALQQLYAEHQEQQQQEQEQQQQQQPSQQQRPVGELAKPKGPLGHILTPVYYLLQQGSQHIAQHFGAPAAAQQHQQQQQRQHQQPQHQQRQQQQEAVNPQQPERTECTAAGDAAAQQEAAKAQAATCATSTTSTSTVSSVLTPEVSNSVAGDVGSGAPSSRRAAAADSGCDSDAEAGAAEPVASPGADAAAADVEDDEDEEWFDPLLFISRLPPAAPASCAHVGTLLPRRTRTCKQKTLVLDLDETLVHSTLDNAPGSEGAHFHFPVHFNGAEHMVHVRMRPHMREFLECAAELFELVVFTASQKVYAEKLLNILDPQRRLIRHRIYRDSCVFVEGNYLKDLSGLGRDLAHTCIIDNSPQAFGFQVDNGIPIESWYDDDQDTELLQLLPLLKRLADADDVRPVLRECFRMRERVQGAAAVWRSRMEQEAMAAAAWQRQYITVVQQQQAAVQQAAANAANMMQQALPMNQLRAAAAAAVQLA